MFLKISREKENPPPPHCRKQQKEEYKAVVRKKSWLCDLVAQSVKNPPVMQETWVQSSGEGNGNPSSLAWEIPLTEEPSGLQSMRLHEYNTTSQLNLWLFSGGCGRRGNLRTEHKEHCSRNQNTVLQKPGRPPANHMTPGPSWALLYPQVLIDGNTCLASLASLGQQLRVLRNYHQNKCKLRSLYYT